MNSSAGIGGRQKNQNIQVYVRVRPLNAREKGIRSYEVVDVLPPKEITVKQLQDSKMTKRFTFDKTFGTDSKQCEVYQSVVAPLIEEVLSGYNCTVFAYGQTGTGKTHTMVGTECPELKSSWEDETEVGIIPRALSHLFDELRLMEVEFSMRISYLELYNEELCDLLSTDDSVKIRIFDDSTKKGSVIVQGLEEIPVQSKDDVYKLLEKGNERRKTATTLMNAQSSRSHTVFSILVHIKENGIDGEEMLKIGKLNLVDLAGSENISKAGNEKGIRTRETVNINQSLLTLGRVITALVERTPHIPYRESKLTRLLQESLGGRTKTSIIATVSPGHKDLEETLSTLEYAHRAKNIQNKPEVNQKLSKREVIKEYIEEIEKLKREVVAARDKNGIYLPEETYCEMQVRLESQNRELNEKMLMIKVLKDELASKERLFNEVSLHLVEKAKELKKVEKEITETKIQLDHTKKVLTTTQKRYKEKKHLLGVHVKTEEELKKQAKQIMEVAEIATNDTVELHNSIDRRRNVDNQITTVTKQFNEKMCQSFITMSGNLNNFLHDHRSYSQLVIDDIRNNIHQREKFTEMANNTISSISSQNENNLQDLINCIEMYSTKFTSTGEDHKSLFSSFLQELKEKQSLLKSNLHTDLNELKSIFSEQKSLHENHFKNIAEEISKIGNLVSNYKTLTMRKLEEYTKETSDDFENGIKAILTNVEKEREILERRGNLVSEFVKNLQQLDKENLIEIAKRENIGSTFESGRNRVTQNIQNEMKSLETFDKDLLKHTTVANSIVSTTQNEMINFADRVNSLNGNMKTILDACSSEQNQIIVQGENELINLTENLNKMKMNCTEDLSGKKNNSIENISKNVSKTYDIISNENKRIEHHETQIEAYTISMETSVSDYSSNFVDQLSICKSNVNKFSKEELKTYSPTGNTPSRKEFSFPKVLVATSPHERLLKRFRSENTITDMDTSTATILEDTEYHITDILEGTISTNSTPVNGKYRSDLLKSVENCFNSTRSSAGTKYNDSVIKMNSPIIRNDNENKENCA